MCRADSHSDCTDFILFLLIALRDALAAAIAAQPVSRAKTRVEMQVEMRVERKPKTPEQVLALLAAEPDLTLKEVAARLDKATSTIERAAAGLVKAGRLRFTGSRKSGHWEVLPD